MPKGEMMQEIPAPRKKRLSLMQAVAALFLILPAVATVFGDTDFSDMDRYFFSGDGHIALFSEKNGKSFTGRYRKSRGQYDESAVASICRVFDAPCKSPNLKLSLRLLEFLDFLEDTLNPGAQITITSGYRNPEYNSGLRRRGGLAAKASLHQYGMAADLKIDGVPARDLWEHVKTLGFGGAGYYQGDTVHIDVGPFRSWDEKTSGVGTDISDGNKLIGLVTHFDVYQPGMRIILKFIRMTSFPINVSSEFFLVRQIDPANGFERVLAFTPSFSVPETGKCPQFADIDQMDDIRWFLPADIGPGRYRIEARFCNTPYEKMPPLIQTPEFEIRSGHKQIRDIGHSSRTLEGGRG
jgi:uncharacterized protein YcbK (DUF882 family)